MGIAVSSPHIVSATPSSSGGGLLTLCPGSCMGSLPWEAVLHKLLQLESCPQATALHELLQHGSPTGSQVLPANLLQCGLLSPRGHRSCQEPASAQASHGVTASFRHAPALASGPPRAAGGDLLHRGLPWAAGGQHVSSQSSPQAAGEYLLRCLKHLLPLLLHWPWCLQSCFSHLFSLLSPAVIAIVQGLFPILNYIITEVLPPSQIGPALIYLGAGWHWLCQTLGNLLGASDRSDPCIPLLPKPCHTNPAQTITWRRHQNGCTSCLQPSRGHGQ